MGYDFSISKIKNAPSLAKKQVEPPPKNLHLKPILLIVLNYDKII